MRVLITGASGLLGRYLTTFAPPDTFLYTNRFDILDKDAVNEAFKSFEPEMVIHCAGEGSVDKAEKYREEAFNLNVKGVQNVMDAAKEYKAHFVYISTNAVYQGFSPPYSEESPRKAINYYGVVKAAAEDAVMKYEFKRSIYRLIFLYGCTPRGSRSHFMTRILKSLKEGEHVKVARDIITQPTHAFEAAETIWKLALTQEVDYDIFNIAPKKSMSLYAFALDIAAACKHDPSLIVPVEAASLGLVPRPMDTSFDVSKLKAAGFELKPPQEGLVDMLNRGENE